MWQLLEHWNMKINFTLWDSFDMWNWNNLHMKYHFHMWNCKWNFCRGLHVFTYSFSVFWLHCWLLHGTRFTPFDFTRSKRFLTDKEIEVKYCQMNNAYCWGFLSLRVSMCFCTLFQWWNLQKRETRQLSMLLSTRIFRNSMWWRQIIFSESYFLIEVHSSESRPFLGVYVYFLTECVYCTENICVRLSCTVFVSFFISFNEVSTSWLSG